MKSIKYSIYTSENSTSYTIYKFIELGEVVEDNCINQVWANLHIPPNYLSPPVPHIFSIRDNVLYPIGIHLYQTLTKHLQASDRNKR